MCVSYSYVRGNTAQDERIRSHVISEREECPDVLCQTSGDADKMGRPTFTARGYYVATVGNVNEETIRNYIREQEENDKLGEATK